MPQLMPLSWFISNMVMFILFLMLVVLYNFVQNYIVVKDCETNLNLYSWCW